ncbi:four helix bundle protein [Sorangium sp. So ce448]|uniref:four helix bundle protein n=1 Tax=Sorangium sp. So ce448 TaxID=3133314 RepID=UPI003F630BCA
MSSTDRPLLDHENLDAYRVTIEFLAFSVQLLEEIPKERRELRLQLERAAMSILLNITGGCRQAEPCRQGALPRDRQGLGDGVRGPARRQPHHGVVQSKDVEQGKRLL